MAKLNINWNMMIKSSQYLLMSYGVAIVTIILLFGIDYDGDIKSFFNILLSTNACFIMTTSYSIRRHAADNHDGIMISQGIGVLICGILMAVSTTYEPVILWLYWGGLLISLGLVMYLTYRYTLQQIFTEKVIKSHEAAENEKMFKEIEKRKKESEFEINGSKFDY